jgi:uncharacterized protein (TIGR03435 family)
MKPYYFLAAIISLALAARAQGPATFDVASVKLAGPLSPGVRTGPSIDRVRARFTYMNLPALAAFAYRLKNFQISAPDWANNVYFSIEANLPEGASVEQVPEMLGKLLEERFKLKLRRETKEFPVYVLLTGAGGSKLDRFARDAPRPRGGLMPMTLEEYATFLSSAADRPVVNMTGLLGQYLFQLNPVVAEANRRRQAEAGRSDNNGQAPEPGSGPLPNIVAELGLKLTPRKVQLPFLVIEDAERTPTQN